MQHSRILTVTALTALCGLTACTLDDLGSPNDLSPASAFNSAPVGMDLVSTSFAASTDRLPWGGPMRGRGGGPGMSGLMGGGLGDAFMGDAPPGRGPQRGPFSSRIDDSCTFAAATGDLTCGPTARGGLNVTTIYTIKTASGAAQSNIDSLTNSIRTRTSVSGTATRGRDGTVTATISNSSDRTVTGLAASSTQRTVNGTSSGSENATGTNRDGQAFTALRTSADTTTGLVIPVSETQRTYPTAGTVVRSMRIVTTITGSAATTVTRREVVTYDGTATAKLTITENGTTKNCTIALPRGRPNCA